MNYLVLANTANGIKQKYTLKVIKIFRKCCIEIIFTKKMMSRYLKEILKILNFMIFLNIICITKNTSTPIRYF